MVGSSGGGHSISQSLTWRLISMETGYKQRCEPSHSSHLFGERRGCLPGMTNQEAKNGFPSLETWELLWQHVSFFRRRSCLVSVAEMNTRTKSNLKAKGLFHFTLSDHSLCWGSLGKGSGQEPWRNATYWLTL